MDLLFIRIAVLYLVVGVALGAYMGMAQNFALAPVHAHVLLAGWLSLAMAGVIYHFYPAASRTLLAKIHFWLHNIGLPIFMLGLALMLTGHDSLPVILPIGALSLLVGLVCFSLNVWLNVKSENRIAG